MGRGPWWLEVILLRRSPMAPRLVIAYDPIVCPAHALLVLVRALRGGLWRCPESLVGPCAFGCHRHGALRVVYTFGHN
jgi:hypothetical protein